MFTIDNILGLAEKHHFFFNSMKMIHVAGTNGKGSTSTMLHNILSTTYQTGIYTSPYDQMRFDNLKIGDRLITDLEIHEIMTRFQDDFEYFKLSEFEIDTWIALSWFYQNACEYAVIEVGLGGKDDATNIITPILSIITNIGTDHQDVLGDTIEKIAAAKAGIIKKEVPCIIGDTLHEEAKKVIHEVAIKMHAPVIETHNLPYQIQNDQMEVKDSNEIYHFPNIASYQIYNISIVLTAIKALNTQKNIITQNMIHQGLSKKLLSKRFEIISKNPIIIMDGAHNLEGIHALISSMKSSYPHQKIVIMMGVLKDKPYLKMIESLQKLAPLIYLFKFHHERALNPELISHAQGIKVVTLPEIKNIIHSDHQVYLFTGSLYFLREAEHIIKEKVHEIQS